MSCRNISKTSRHNIAKCAPSPVSVTENLEQVQRPTSNNNNEDGIYNYVSDNKEDDKPRHVVRCSKRVLKQLRENEKNGLHRIAALAAQETAPWPGLNIRTHKLAKGMAGANLSLQLNKWAYEDLFAGAVLDHNTGAQLEYRDLIKKNPELREQWIRSLTNDIGQLLQGICDIKGTNTFFCIPKSEVPFNRRKDVTYARIGVVYKPDKLEKNRFRVTVGGDRLTVLVDCSAPTADLPTIKCLWNLVLSTPGAKYFTMDVSNFYLGSPMNAPSLCGCRSR